VYKIDIKTRCVHGFKGYDECTGAVSFPIYQSATFRHPKLNQTTGYDYSRLQNPTREELENIIATLEEGRFGFAFSCGMAAISTIIKLFCPGDHVIVSDDLYGGTYRLFEEVFKKFGIEFVYVDTSEIENIEKVIKKNTRGIFIETPSNPMMKVSDIKKISKLSKSNNLLFIVDNTFLTPYYQKPLKLGADIVIHSGTKYLGGHNDTLAGLIVVDDEILADKIKLIQKSEGAVLSPLDSWLIIRGIKTLAIRMDKQQENAFKIADWLKINKNISKVIYVGLNEHKGYDISKSQSSGFGAMISFYVNDSNLVENLLSKLKVIIFAESLGGVESLITYPIVQTHAAIPAQFLEEIGVTNKLLRLSVGIEDVNDILYDLEQAMK
jgi:cystathionine gamma-synthase